MKEIVRIGTRLFLALLKVLLASAMAAFVLAILLTLNTGEPVIGIMFNSSMNAGAIVDDLLKSLVGKLPFAGYVLDAFESGSGFIREDGFGIFHDWIKAMLLFLSTGFFYRMLAKFLMRWNTLIQTETHLDIWIDWVANFELFCVMALVSMVTALLVHDWLITFWTDAFGNGFLSNCGLLAVLLLLLVIAYFVLGAKRRGYFVNALTSILLDFGLVLCVVVFIYYAGMLAKYPEMLYDLNIATAWKVILPFIADIFAGIALIHIKVRNFERK